MTPEQVSIIGGLMNYRRSNLECLPRSKSSEFRFSFFHLSDAVSHLVRICTIISGFKSENLQWIDDTHFRKACKSVFLIYLLFVYGLLKKFFSPIKFCFGCYEHLGLGRRHMICLLYRIVDGNIAWKKLSGWRFWNYVSYMQLCLKIKRGSSVSDHIRTIFQFLLWRNSCLIQVHFFFFCHLIFCFRTLKIFHFFMHKRIRRFGCWDLFCFPGPVIDGQCTWMAVTQFSFFFEASLVNRFSKCSWKAVHRRRTKRLCF